MTQTDRPFLSIVIPTLNEAGIIGSTIDAFKKSGIQCAYEIIVADGGSGDGTREEARTAGATVIPCPPGRGQQLATGAEQAKGDWLLFFHADTEFPPGWYNEAEKFMRDTPPSHRAAVFTYQLDDEALSARLLEVIVKWRTRWLALPYGDQGLLIGQTFYQELHGFARIDIMEDVDIIRRIGRNRLHIFKALAITSAKKYRREGYLFRPLKNMLCLLLYFLAVPPHIIARIYR